MTAGVLVTAASRRPGTGGLDAVGANAYDPLAFDTSPKYVRSVHTVGLAGSVFVRKRNGSPLMYIPKPLPSESLSPVTSTGPSVAESAYPRVSHPVLLMLDAPGRQAPSRKSTYVTTPSGVLAAPTVVPTTSVRNPYEARF